MRPVVIVEDDEKIGALMCDYLKAGGYTPILYHDGSDALIALESDQPSAIILDVMLPRMDGFALCRRLREITAVPILFVTARVDEVDRLQGLASGGDDYLCKPFSMREMVARVDALVRRAEGRVIADPLRLQYAVDEHSGRIAWAGTWLPLSRTEYRLLAALIQAPGRLFTRADLLDRVADEYRDVSDRSIDSHMKNLRRKIAAVDPDMQPIRTVYGFGYRFEMPKPPQNDG